MKKIATAALMASVALSPISPLTVAVRADSGDVIAGIIVGGIIGSAVAKDKKKKKKSTGGTAVSSAAKEQNKEVQTALNYFGYNVGTPDGAIGPKSRAAISEYQAFLGYPATGELTENERLVLVTAYQRAVAGGSVIAETVASSPYGLKAVLIAQRDEMAGVAPGTELAGDLTASTASSVTEAAEAALPRLMPETVGETDAEVVEVASEEPALPSFMDPSGANGSLAAECDAIGLATAGNGGMTTADTMQDASFALGEQFCLARGFAIASSQALTAQLASFTPEQIAAQCAAFGPVLKDHVAALSLKPAAEVLAGVEGFVLSSTMSPAQLSGTAKVCLGAGYAQDDMSVAIGSALLLAGMGERAYSEYLGHHLSQGFGATERPDLAMDWYQMSLDAMEQGRMVVAPEVSGRDALILKAAYTINGRGAELAPEEVQEAALPVFDIAPEEEAVADPAVVTEVAADSTVEVAPEPEETEVIIAASDDDAVFDGDVAAGIAAAAAEDLAAADGLVIEEDLVIDEELATVEELVVIEPAGNGQVQPEATEVAVVEPEILPEATASVEAETGLVGSMSPMAILAVRLPLMILTAY